MAERAQSSFEARKYEDAFTQRALDVLWARSATDTVEDHEEFVTLRTEQ
jgi:hypothetical protein